VPSTSTALARGYALALLLVPPGLVTGAVSTTRLDWGSKASLPIARTGLNQVQGGTRRRLTLGPCRFHRGFGLGLAVAPNGNLYAVGGGNITSYLGRVEEYTPGAF